MVIITTNTGSTPQPNLTFTLTTTHAAAAAAASTLPPHYSDSDSIAICSSSTSDSDSEDLLQNTFQEDDVTAQLAAAGPIGMAAAAAIASAKKRKRPHAFETNPSIRKRQQTRLLRKLRQTIDEFTIRVGMQAVVLVAIPGKQNNCYKCFGAKPLEDVLRGLRPVVMQDLEQALAAAAPLPAPDDPSLHELPPLVIDGIPTPVEKMTQAQLRAFIPLMLKYSTGRGKPGWGKESTRPGWWPGELPWANVRMDARSEEEKQKVSWTHALRQIVVNCYRHHGREDLLPVFSGEHSGQEEPLDIKPAKLPKIMQQQQHGQLSSEKMFQICEYLKQQEANTSKLATVLQTNPDGSVSLLHVDPGGVITLPDGSTAQVQGVATLQQSAATSTPTTTHPTINIDLSQLQNLDTTQQLIITGEDGRAYPVTVSGMISVPLQQQQQQSWATEAVTTAAGGHVQIITTGGQPTTTTASGLLLPKIEPPEPPPQFPSQIPVSALTGDPAQTQLVSVSSTGQVVHEDKVYQICEYGGTSFNTGGGEGQEPPAAAES